MAKLAELLDKSAKGGFAEEEDWWWLCYDTDTREFFVEHEWDHVDVHRLHKVNKGSDRYKLEGYSGVGASDISAAMERLKAQINAQESKT